ncbi:hypothetical protein BHE90_006507 [Fusarium euwallaceae]|uniref:Uncharacterized protein n=1 Tax=Fusarium euwallaceae TaxID=1147111 RepID=A0A430LTH3_9HYPO|nr:hypothetical protein BHE90_006507 [Fusarium euwallaceae]
MPCNCGGGNEADAWKKAAKFDGYQTYDQSILKASKPRGSTTAVVHKQGYGVTVTHCSTVIASLGTDRDREICTTDCQSGGKGQNSVWCRIALDDSNISVCASLGYDCLTV